MAFRRRTQLIGDPGLFGFLGGIARKGLGIAGSILPGPAGVAARAAGGLLGGRKARRAAKVFPGGLVVQRQAAFGAPTRRRGPAQQLPGAQTKRGKAALAAARAASGIPKRRTMNVNNPKALRRATRRLSSWNKQKVRIEKELRKLAPPRRSSRRDIPAGHTHVR